MGAVPVGRALQHAGSVCFGSSGQGALSQHVGLRGHGQGVLSQHVETGGELGLRPGGGGNLSGVQEPDKWHQWPRMSRPGTRVCGSQDRGPGRPATVSGHWVPAQHPRGCDRAPCGSGEVLTATLAQGGSEVTSASCQAAQHVTRPPHLSKEPEQPQTHRPGAGDRDVGVVPDTGPLGRPSCCPAPEGPDSSVWKKFSG